MASFKSDNPLHKKWKVGTREIIYIISGILMIIYMLFFFFREVKKEENFQKHINKEHGHAG
jgi:uncharacterized membrane protein YuzA (DUF378 family)